ncbi:DUF167 domain-containing protein [Candidatus Micrarchaeota archaeon]|nr:DUF167 domain-containing protein [Candidatus Micrarchaeota archaeon]
MILGVSVVPASPKFRITAKDGAVKIYLKSPPEQNKANLELIRGLEDIFGKPVRILSGAASKKKKIEIPAGEQEWEKFLSTL